MKLDLEKNFDFNKVRIQKISSDWMNMLMNHINKSIQDGIDKGVDIDGKPFAPVSQFTKNSKHDKQGHKRILERSGRMRQTRLKRPTPTKMTFEIVSGKFKSKSRWSVEYKGKKSSGTRQKPKYNYGTFHQPAAGKTFQMINYTSPDSLIPDKKVPIRKWFGIPKNMLPNGLQWKKFELQFNATFQRFLTTAMRKFKL